MFGWHELPMGYVILGILVLMMAANEIGFRLGRSWHRGEAEPVRNVSNTLKASVFGLAALLLGFSFSMTASRYDQRRKIVLDESNTIGTCYLRAGLMPTPHREKIRSVLRQYVAARISYFNDGLDPVARGNAAATMNQLLAELWAEIERANPEYQDAIRTSMIVSAANDVIDMSSTRDWSVRGGLPLPIFILLIACVLVSSLLMGHSSGQTARRHAGLWFSFNFLFVLLLFAVLDFDHPRRGLVRTDHTPFLELQASFGSQKT